jgi:hypothetical protein
MATKEQVYEFARQEAQRQGVPFSLVQKIVETESGGSFNAIGPKTRFKDRAYGPMQLMGDTAKDLGVNRMDWKDNIRGGVKYLGQLSDRFQDPTLVAAAYNAGPGNVEKYGGVPPFKETQNYVQKVVGTNMATYRDIDPKFLGEAPQQNPKIDLRGMATTDQQQSGNFRDVDPSMLGETIVDKAPTRQMSAKERALELVGQVGRQVALTPRYGLEGIGQAADIVGTPLNMLINRATGSNLQPPSQAMSNFATMLGLPQPATGLEKGVANVTRAVAGIPAMGGVGGLLQQSARATTQAVGRGLAAQPVAQVAGATAGTGASEFAQRQFDIQNPLALLGINLAAGLPAGAMAARAGNVPSGTRYQDPTTGQIVESAAQRGVKVDVGDVGGPGAGAIDKLRQFGFSRESTNQAKADQVKKLIEKTTENLRPAKMAEGGEKSVIANDLRQQYRTAKDNVKPKFDRAEKLAGDTQIPLGNANNATIEVLDKFPALSETPVINKVIQDTNSLLQSGGGTYKELRNIQKTVGAELNRVQESLGTYNEPQKSALLKLYNGLGNDVDAWAAPRTINNKPVYTPAGAEHARAMEQFKDTVLPFRQDPSIYKIVSSKTPRNEIDLAAEKFNFDTNPKTSELAFNLMSPVGKQAAQYSILNEARNKAITPDAAAEFSAAAFTRTLNLGRPDSPTAQRIAFADNPSLLDEVTTLRDIVDTTRGAVTPKATPFTGGALLPYVAGFGGIGGGASYGRNLAQSMEMGDLGTGLMTAASAAAVPVAANRLANVLSSQTGTRFLLGEQLQGAGGMGTALGQAMTEATNNPDNFIPKKPVQGLFDMFRD